MRKHTEKMCMGQSFLHLQNVKSGDPPGCNTAHPLHKVPPFQWLWPAIGGFVPAPRSSSNWIYIWIGICQLKPPSHSTALNNKQMVTPIKNIKTLWVRPTAKSHADFACTHACVRVCAWTITLFLNMLTQRQTVCVHAWPSLWQGWL